MNDPIDRQAAIDALRYAQHRFTVADEAGGIGTVKWSEDVIYFAAAERILTELPSAQPDIVRCKDCKYFEYDHLYFVQDIPAIGHLVCNKWGDGCRTDENGFCFMGEMRTDAEIL